MPTLVITTTVLGNSLVEFMLPAARARVGFLVGELRFLARQYGAAKQAKAHPSILFAPESAFEEEHPQILTSAPLSIIWRNLEAELHALEGSLPLCGS